MFRARAGQETAVEEPLVRVSHAGSVRTLALNRPQALNSFTAAMHGELRSALDAAAVDREVRCVVVTGTGRGFCAGQDLADPAVAPNRDQGGAAVDVGSAIERFYKPLALRIRSMPVPVVAAVNGVAAGAGANFALLCDIVVAARSASFIQAFSKIGLIPDCGGTWLLPRLVGRANAVALAMLGDKLGAEDAVRLGLIWKCVDDAVLPGRGRRRSAARLADAADAAPSSRPAGTRRIAAPRPRGGAELEGRRASARSALRTTSQRRRPPSWPSGRRSSPIAEADDDGDDHGAGRWPAKPAPAAPDPQGGLRAHVAADRARKAWACASSPSAPARPRSRWRSATTCSTATRSATAAFITTLADSAFAFACNSRNELTVASGLTVDFLAPVKRGDLLTADAVEVARTGRTGVYDIVVTNRAGARVALVRGRSARLGDAPSSRSPPWRRNDDVAPTPARRARADRARRASTSCARSSSSACAGPSSTPTTTSPTTGGRSTPRASIRRTSRSSPTWRAFPSRQGRPARPLSVRHASPCRASASRASTRRRGRPGKPTVVGYTLADIDTGPTWSRARSAPPAAGRATWSTSPTATASSPAASARTTAPSAPAAP
jgi:2-(1,2-epoxy-1,2-dihydrophenyl)acetyl-CoA isomerase